MTSRKKVPYDIILRAQQQDEEATIAIVKHYRKEIQRLALCEFVDENGQKHWQPDDDIVLRLQTRLMLSIAKFNGSVENEN